MNRCLWRIHSWMGLFSGIGLLLIGLTGSLLVFSGELEIAVTPSLFRAQPSSKERLPLDYLFAGVKKALPDHEVSSWYFATRAGAVDRAFMVKHGGYERDLVAVDPHTGNILGGPLDARRTVMGRVMELHYTFFAGRVGTLLAGIFAVLLCLLGLSGLWLYNDFWSTFLRLRWCASWQILFSDLHKTVGITSLFFQLILGFTGAYWNLPMAVRQFRFGAGLPARLLQQNWSPSISLDALLNVSRQALPGFLPTYIGFPIVPGADIQIGGHTDNPFRSDYCNSIAFDAQSGAVKQIRDIRKARLKDQIIDTFRPLHYGTFGGLFVKMIWCLGGLTPGFLAITGFFLWTRRRMGRKTGIVAADGDA